MRDYCAIARQYCEDVRTGKVPAGKYVRAACERQEKDLERWAGRTGEYYFDEKAAARICKFIELLPHIKGPLAGKLIVLEPWQIFILTTVFGWMTAASRRRFRRVYVEVPRGNGKSALSSGVGLYMLAADGEGGAEVYSAATTRDQAQIVFGDAQNMARKSPGLQQHFGVSVHSYAITQMRSGSKFVALAAEGSTMDGLNTHFACIDELHAHKTRAVYDVIETSMGKRDQSLLWVITTAGSNRSGICYEVRGFVLRVLNGSAEDDSQFGIVYGLDEGDDWTSEYALIKANPNWGVSVQPDVVKKLQLKAMTMASAANNFKTKHLDDWVNADVAWMDMRAWNACADATLQVEQFYGEECYEALDLASKVDVAARMRLFPKDIDGVRHYYAFGKYYLPRDTIEQGENAHYSGWETEGRIIVTEGAVIDFDRIEKDVIEDCSSFYVREVPYDPFQATQLASHLLAEGVQMVEVRATVANFSEPMKLLEALVLEKRFHHDDDPVLEWMVSNVVCHVDAKDNIYPRKERPENKIDGVVALIMALNRAIANEATPAAGFASLDD